MNINVYQETGYPNADEMFVKAKIVSVVADIMRATGLTQNQVASMAGLTQPQVSNILKGKFRDISLEKLFRILISLKHSVRISVDSLTSESPEVCVEISPGRDAHARDRDLVSA